MSENKHRGYIWETKEDGEQNHSRKAYFSSLRASHYMGLSLYIILLAFFIMLTSLSDINQNRSKNVMQSVQQTFDPFVSLKTKQKPSDNERQKGRTKGLLPKAQLKEFFGQTIGDLRLKESSTHFGGSQMSVFIAPALLRNYLPAISEEVNRIIENPDLSSSFDLEVFIAMKEDSDQYLQKKTQLKNLVERFLNAGFPEKNLSVGLEILGAKNREQPLDDIELRFVFSNAYNPLGENK